MDMKKSLLVLFLGALALSVYGQKAVPVCGQTTYHVPETQSQADAKRTAIERARIQALADEFGTVVSQTNTMSMHSAGGQAQTDFNSFSANDVRGVWIEDTREPEIKMTYENDQLVIFAKVCGKAREIKGSQVELLVETLNYGSSAGKQNPTRKGEVTDRFRNNDFFGVHFKSPVNGYVALFIRDDNSGMVYTQLPYQGADGYARTVRSNQDYVFLNNEDPDYARLFGESVILTTERTVEHNTLIVVFSKNPFNLSLSEQGRFFQETELPKFQKWLHDLRKHDAAVQVQEIVLTIQK